LFSGPANRGAGAEKSSFELLLVVFDVCHFEGTVPFHVEGDLRMNWEDRRDGGSGKPQPLCQRIGKVMVVENIQAADEEARPSIIEVDFDGAVFHRDHPEYIVTIDVHIIVVNLINEFGRSYRTGIEVKSNKSKRTSVLVAVRTDESALAETHIRLEG